MKLKPWIEATRLRTLPVSVAAVVATLGYNYIYNNVNYAPWSLCLAFAVLCQIASNYANEYFDYTAGRDRAGREGPRRGVTEGDITPRAMRRAIAITLLAAACTGLCLVAWGGWWLIAVGAAVGIGVFAYSTGPFPLSTLGLGEVAVVIFFGIVPVCLTYYVETLQWSVDVLAGGVSLGLLGANVLIINNYRDIEDDAAVGKRTLAVRYGRGAMRVMYLGDAAVAVVLMAPQWNGTGAWAIVPAATLCAAVAIFIAMGRRRGASLTPLLGMTAMTMCAYALGFALACYFTR